MTLPSEKALARYEAELEEKRQQDEDAEAKAQEEDAILGAWFEEYEKTLPVVEPGFVATWHPMTWPTPAPASTYFGPKCGSCGSRRTRRVGDTAFRMCCDCSNTGKIVCDERGTVLRPLEE